MNARLVRSALFLALPAIAALPAGIAHGGDATAAPQRLQLGYHVERLETLGGASSVGHGISNRGWIAGRANLPDGTRRAALWRNGNIHDLGTLGGHNSAVAWPVRNVRGIVVGISQTAQPDPHGESWSCSAFFAVEATGQQCVGFVWKDGVMRPLDTLGGTHGYATGANNPGQIVGWAENTVEDDSCRGDQIFQFRAAVWRLDGKVVRELPPLPLPGHSTSAATALNDRGQVVGISGECDVAVGRRSAMHAVLWENGQPTRLDDFGGTAWNTPTSINQRGDVVGFLNASATDGDVLNPRAALWLDGGGVQDLGMLAGDDNAFAYGINVWRQVVGSSCAGADCRAFLWQGGEQRLLQDLVVSGDTLVLTSARDIDDLGRITGQAFDEAGGQFVAFIATPRLVWR